MIKREDFLQSNHLHINVLTMEKKIVQRNKIILEVVTDRMSIQSKKTYSSIRKLSEILEKKFAENSVTLSTIQLSDSKKLQDSQKFFNRINTLTAAQDSPIRNYVYNFLFHDEDTNEQRQSFTLKQSLKQSLVGGIKQKIQSKMQAKEQGTQALKPSIAQIQKVPINSLSILKKEAFKDNKSLKQIFKSINQIWIKRKGQWNLHGIQLDESSIVLSSNNAHDRTCVIVCNCKIDLEFIPYTRLIVYNKIDLNKLEMRLTKLGNGQQETKEVNQKYLALYTALKELANKNKQKVLNRVGIRISIKDRQQKKQLKDFAIKLAHQTISAVQIMRIDSTINFSIPIINNYGNINIDVIESKQSSILSTFKKQCSCLFQIPVQTIYDHLYNQKPKKRTPQLKSKLIQTKATKVQVNLQFYELGGYSSYISCNSSQIYEGDTPPVEWNRQESRVHINRIRRILWKLETYNNKLKDLLNFTIPSISYVFYLFLTLFIFFFDGNYMLSFILGALILTIIMHHPLFDLYSDQLIGIVKDTELCKNIRNRFPSLGSEDYGRQYRLWFQKDKQKQRFLMNFQMNMRKKRNIYKKYKRLQELLLKAQNLLMGVATWIQKIKNLVEWYHYKKTMFAIKMLVALFLFVTFLPLRYIILFGVFARMKKGKRYHAKTRTYNQMVVNQVFKLCINQHHLEHMKYYTLKPAQLFDKKNSQFITFEKKSKEYIVQLLALEYEHSKIFHDAKNMSELLFLMSLSAKKYKFTFQICKKYGFDEQWAYQPSTSAKIGMAIVGFLSNIPSDRYILNYKPSKIASGSDEAQQEDQQAHSSQEFLFL